MIQKLPNCDLLSVIAKFGKDLAECCLVAQLLVMNEQHHGHSRELLAHRSQTEICLCIDSCPCPKFLGSVTALKNHNSILFYENSQSRRLVCGQALKYGSHLFLVRP